MKFKFCSNGDCPLWALAALHALSSLPAALFCTLLQHVMEEQPDDGIMEILKDTSLASRDECARAAAVIKWVLKQTWRCSCPSSQLTKDLLMLGVPRTHASALAEAVDVGRDSYVAHASSIGFSVHKVTDAKLTQGPEEAIDVFKLTVFTDEVFIGEQKIRELLIDKSQAKVLLDELKKAHEKMKMFEENNETNNEP